MVNDVSSLQTAAIVNRRVGPTEPVPGPTSSIPEDPSRMFRQKKGKRVHRAKWRKRVDTRDGDFPFALELGHPEPSGSHQAGIGSEPSMLMKEIGDRPIIDELAVFANAIWV